MGVEITGFLHAGYRIGTAADQVDEAVVFYREVLGLEIDGTRPQIATIPGGREAGVDRSRCGFLGL
jgi:hypothetical protein